MRSMVLLIDANVLLIYYKEMIKNLDSSNIIIKKCAIGEYIGYIVFILFLFYGTF